MHGSRWDMWTEVQVADPFWRPDCGRQADTSSDRFRYRYKPVRIGANRKERSPPLMEGATHLPLAGAGFSRREEMDGWGQVLASFHGPNLSRSAALRRTWSPSTLAHLARKRDLLTDLGH